MPFDDAGVRIKVQNDAGNRGASLAKRIMTPAEVALLIRSAPSRRDRILIEVFSPHWLRHAHGSHAIDEGAPLHEVQTTLGHANVSTTSGYPHARPDSSSGLKLDPGVFLHNAND